MEDDLVMCTICHQREKRERIRHLPIYVIGSEGVWACTRCRIFLSKFIQLLMEFRGESFKEAFKELRKEKK